MAGQTIYLSISGLPHGGLYQLWYTTKIVIYFVPLQPFRAAKENGSVPFDSRFASSGHVAGRKREHVQARGEADNFLPVLLNHDTVPGDVIVIEAVAAAHFFIEDTLEDAVIHPIKDFLSFLFVHSEK